MSAIALIRHGAYRQLPNTPSALQPYPLTAKGEAEVRSRARQFGDWLTESGYRLDPEVHCSTLLRAWQTAELFREELSELFAGPPKCLSFAALCERSVGALANLTVAEIERIVELDPRLESLPPKWKSTSDFRLPFDGAESLLEAGERVASHLRHCLHSPADKQVRLIVGHGASIRHACYCLDIIKFDDIQRLSMFYGHPVVFEARAEAWAQLFGHWKPRQSKDPID
ncbi:MAG: histidine phosphatase family protein [Marinobacter sp.]|uniref:histidine phosphatase family protein n=1 Tax=Marinobacter sp. TaxID=50741 RepID=UPI003566C154